MYHFEGRIVHRNGYNISRDISRGGYYYRVSCRAPRQMHGQICPPWVPDIETADKVRNASLYLTLQSIALHILIISELDIVFC